MWSCQCTHNSSTNTTARCTGIDDLASLVYKEPGLLDLDAGTAVASMVALVQSFPNRDVLAMVAAEPRLMVLPDLEQRMESTLSMLKEIHPSHSIEVVRDIVQVRHIDENLWDSLLIDNCVA